MSSFGPSLCIRLLPSFAANFDQNMRIYNYEWFFCERTLCAAYAHAPPPQSNCVPRHNIVQAHTHTHEHRINDIIFTLMITIASDSISLHIVKWWVHHLAFRDDLFSLDFFVVLWVSVRCVVRSRLLFYLPAQLYAFCRSMGFAFCVSLSVCCCQAAVCLPRASGCFAFCNALLAEQMTVDGRNNNCMHILSRWFI